MDKKIKKIAKDFVLATLKEPFYLNIVCPFKQEEKQWVPCWEEKYVGSTDRNKAVELRRQFFDYLKTHGSSKWKEKYLKTVKIKYYT